ncbi:MAG: hypothetical protein F6K58_17130 [Symploca sp. SIO2E9]|nr:hypothetical protein [Symploca sp. SIO2E9]
MGGYPTYQGEKADLSLKLCLAGLKLPKGYRQCQIKKLAVCTPNQLATEKIVRMKDALRGVHSFERNELALTVNIYEVECQPETLGAWRYANNNGLYKWKRPNAILDLGGKTGIGQVYMPSGMAPVDGRVIVSGTYDLAKLIAAEDKQLAALDTSADLGKIMDAIANGSYTYATFEQSISFTETFHTCLYKWITGIRDRLKTQWQKYLPQLGEVLIIGGSAPLANELVLKTNGRFKVAENHKTINVQGMLIDG